MINLPNFTELLTLLQNSSYFIIFLVMIFEGPAITVIAASAASAGLFNIYLIFILSFLGNILGDLIYFFTGKVGRNVFINRHLKFFKTNKKKVMEFESVLKNNPIKAMLTIKLVPNLGGPGLIMAGAVNIPFRKFIILSLVISFCYSLFFTLTGFYIGIAFVNLLKYFDYAGWLIIFLIILSLIFFIIYNQISKRIYNKLKNFKK